jgi:DNA-binding PadR family transcriptional regulator
MIRHALLGLLREQPDYGYHLKRRFDERIGSVWHLNIGQVYQTLQALDRAGLIAEVSAEASNGGSEQTPARRLYQLTPKGLRVLERWLKRPPTRPHPVRDETLIHLLVLQPGKWEGVLDRLAKQEHIYKKHLTALLSQKRRLPDDNDQTTLGVRLGLEAALLHTEAHIKWLDYCRQRITKHAEEKLKAKNDPD